MYDHGVELIVRGELDWENEPVRVLLVTPDYVPSQADDTTVADSIGLRELRSNGTYERGGAVLEGRTVESGTVPGAIVLHGGTVEWRLTGEFRYAVLATSDGHLVAYSDLGYQHVTDAPVRITYPEHGVALFNVAPTT